MPLIDNKLTDACRRTVRMASPLVGSRLLHALNGFISMILIARLGRNAVATSALVYSTVSLWQLAAWAMLYAMGAVVARAFGAQQQGQGAEEMGDIVRQACFLGFLVGVPVTLLLWNAATILVLFGQPAVLLKSAQAYFHGVAWGVLPSIWYTCFSEFVTGISRPRLVMIWTALSMPPTLLLAYGLLFGHFGLPAVGIAGVAYAISIMFWSLFIGIALYFYWHKDYRCYKLFERRLGFVYVKQLFQLGWPISVQLGAEMAVFTMLTYMMGWLGPAALAAQQVLLQCNTMIIMLPYGMAQAAAVTVGQACGQRRFDLARYRGNAGMLLASGAVFCAVLVYWFAPKLLIGLYLNLHDPASARAVQIAVSLLTITAFTLIFDAVRLSVTGALRGFQDTRAAMYVGLVIGWVMGVPLGYWFAFRLHWGAAGILLGFCLGSLLGAIILVRRFHRLCSGVYSLEAS